MYRQAPDQIELEVLYGEIQISHLRLPFLKDEEIKSATVDGKPADFRQQAGEITFNDTAILRKDSRLVLRRRS